MAEALRARNGAVLQEADVVKIWMTCRMEPGSVGPARDDNLL